MTTLVVTRHPSLVDYLVEIGLIEPGTEVVAQVTAEQVEGKHIIGVLPINLAALAEKVTMVPLQVPPELRGKELTIDQVRELAGAPATYVVRQA